MTDDLDEGPDPNDVRRHAKRMFTELQYRQKYRRIDFYRPNEKQQEFHNLTSREFALRAGNQNGKTHAAGAHMTMVALNYYPGWYEGLRHVKPRIERSVDFMGWAACTTSTKTRDGAQTKLLGPVRDEGGLGTGLIPLDNIVGRPTMARGIADFVDSVTLRREDSAGGTGAGGRAMVRFKTYEMGREAFQGEPVDLVWLDEDVSKTDDSIYGECLARLTTTRGRIMCSLTPLLGMSPLRKRFKQRAGDGCAEVLMTIWDAAESKGGHIPDEDIPGIIASYTDRERATRAFGSDMQGEGAVFSVPVEQIKYVRDPREFPAWWKWMWALDFRHSGSETSGHPFAAVLGVRDPDNDVIYVVEAFKMLGLAPMHVARIKANQTWQAPVAWPHDGGRGASLVSGETVAMTYKKLGLHMLAKHATFTDGGFNFSAGIQEMENRFGSGRLKVAAHLHDFFDEYQGYHYENNAVVKVDDDILSATRILCMAIRHAQPRDQFIGFGAQTVGPAPIADGVDFDLFSGA